jgi:class 3 adenylate cyclase
MTLPEPAANPILPSGLVTFLFADIADSTRLWEQDAPAMRAALARYAAILAAAVTAAGGVVPWRFSADWRAKPGPPCRFRRA